MSSKFKIVSIGLLAAGAIAGSTAVASAGVTPTPYPTHTVPVPTPRPVPTNWTFDGTQLFVNRGPVLPDINVNNVEGRGALLMRGWVRVPSPNPAIDTFRLGLNSVTLLHNPLRQAVFEVNPYTCTVKFDQTGRFRIINGTGTGRNLQSRNGQFELNGLASYPLTRNQLCVLRFVSIRTIIRAVQNGSPVLGVNPSEFSADFQGRALVTRTPVVIRPFAPTVSPTDTVTPDVTPSDSLSA